MRPRLIGLAGGSCSGKGALARSLMAQFGDELCVLELDDYYRDLEDYSEASIIAHNYDEPAAFDIETLSLHLDALMDGVAVEQPIYDFSAHRRRATTRTCEPRPFLLLEGILVLAIEVLRTRCDLRIYVDAPEDTRLARRIERDARQRGRDEGEVRQRFLQHVAAMHATWVEPSRRFADLVIDGSADVEHNSKTVVQRLASL